MNWEDIKRYGKQYALRGTGLGMVYEHFFPPQMPGLPTRPPLGAEGKVAAQEQAKAMQSALNQQLMQSIVPMINREWAGAGRYASGQRTGAIERAMGGAQSVLGQQVGQSALQRYLADLQGTIQREQIGAQYQLGLEQLGAGQGGVYEDLGKLLLMLYLGGGKA